MIATRFQWVGFINSRLINRAKIKGQTQIDWVSFSMIDFLSNLRFLTVWFTFIINNPYLMTGIFLQILLLTVCSIRRVRKFVRLVIFLVYIGGIMILIRYCIILLPDQKLFFQVYLLVPFIFISRLFRYTGSKARSYSYGLIIRRTLLLLRLLLWFVLLAVIEITGYPDGMIKT